MRWFFLLLLITNLGGAGWLYWRSQTTNIQTTNAGNIPAAKRLQLLSELPPNALQPVPHVETVTEPTAAPAPTEPAPSGPSTPDRSTLQETKACVRITLLGSEDDLKKLTRKLTAPSLAIHSSGEEFTERQIYWVLIPPYQSPNAARDALAKLAKANVRDFQLIPSGEFKDGISLGLFSQQEGAESRLQEIVSLKLGIRSPEIRPRTAPVRSRWLIVQASGDDAQKLLLQLLAAEGMQASTITCPP